MTATAVQTTTTRTAIYPRQSLDANGQGMAVTRQIELGYKLAEARQWTVTVDPELTCDNDLSAAGKVDRPGFERLIAMIEAGEIDAVIAQAMDRLARNQRDGVRLLEAAKKARVRIAFLNGGDIDLTSPMGEFVANMMILIAKLEIDTKGARQKAANRQRAKLGTVRTSTPRPFGWDDDRVSHRPVEAAAVADAYATILAGGSLRSIAAAWNADPLLPCPQRRIAKNGQPRGQVWKGGTVRDVLLNPHHAALTSIGGEILGEGDWTPIVERSTWEAVRAILSRSAGNGSRGVRSMLGGIVQCPCGAKMTAAKNVRGQPVYRHQRPAGLDDGGQTHIARRREPVDDYISGLVVDLLSRPEAADLLRTKGPNSAQLTERREALLRRADEVAGSVTRMQMAGIYTERQARRALDELNGEIKPELDEIDRQLTDARRLSVLGDLINAENVAEEWERFHVDRKRAVIRELIDGIVLLSPGMGRYPKPVDETVIVSRRVVT